MIPTAKATNVSSHATTADHARAVLPDIALSHNARLFPVYAQTQIRFQSLYHPELHDWPNITSHDYKVIRIPDQSNVGTTVRTIFIFMKGPVKLMQKNIGKASLPHLGGVPLRGLCMVLLPSSPGSTTGQRNHIRIRFTYVRARAFVVR